LLKSTIFEVLGPLKSLVNNRCSGLFVYNISYKEIVLLH
jgi:hypothetical protein